VGVPSVVLKLYFAKAFDTVDHEAIMNVFEIFGFDLRWLNFLRMIMSTSTSLVLLNGVPEIFFAIGEVFIKGIHSHLYYVGCIRTSSGHG
jgi:hypothetical protein